MVAEMKDDAVKGFYKRFSKRTHLKYCKHHGMKKLNVAWQYEITSVLSVRKNWCDGCKMSPSKSSLCSYIFLVLRDH